MKKEIFTRHVLFVEPTLYRISKSMLHEEADCEDAVQKSILKAYEKLDTLKEESYFNTWLIRILMNECYTIIKKKNRIVPYEDYMEKSVEYHVDETNEIYQAVLKLPLKIRMTIVLFYVEGYSVEEIKTILNIPSGTVKSRLAKGRKLLQKDFGNTSRNEVKYGTI